MSRIGQIARRSLPDLIWPPICAGCGERGTWVCNRCQGSLALAGNACCPRCGDHECACARIPAGLVALRSIGPHAGWLQEAVHSVKYGGERARTRHLGAMLAPALGDLLAAEPLALVVPVPLHPARQRERGFNQAELFARAALETIKRTPGLDPDALWRVRQTRQQVGLDAGERLQNVAGAFLADVDRVAARPVIVVDDVLTTGSTLSACAVALLDAGAAGVSAVTLSRAGWPADHWAIDRSSRGV